MIYLMKATMEESVQYEAVSDYYVVSANSLEEAHGRCKEYNPTFNWEEASLDEAYRGFALVTTP